MTRIVGTIFLCLVPLLLNAQTSSDADPAGQNADQQISADQQPDNQSDEQPPAAQGGAAESAQQAVLESQSAPAPEPAPSPRPTADDDGEQDEDSTVFIPTEEISDDLPVPFPVDI